MLSDGGVNADAKAIVFDSLSGLAGNDTYYVNNSGDTITESNGTTGGVDTVISSVSYTLSASVENLTLTGALNTTATASDSTRTSTSHQ